MSAAAQVSTVGNTDFPTFRSNLNASLGNAASITGNYVNPSWIVSLAYSKITGVPSFLTTVPAPGVSTLGGVVSGQCTTVSGKLMGYDTAGNRICEADQTSGVGSGITSMNGLTPSSQTFTNDANVTIVSSGSAHVITWVGTLPAGRLNPNVVQVVANDTNITGSIVGQTLTLNWSGALAKARQHAATVYSDASYSDPSWLTMSIAKITSLQAALDAKENANNKGIANGYAGLGSDGKVPDAYLHTVPAMLGYTPQDTAQKGTANGYAGLGSDGKVPAGQLPASSSGATIPAVTNLISGNGTGNGADSGISVNSVKIALCSPAVTTNTLTFDGSTGCSVFASSITANVTSSSTTGLITNKPYTFVLTQDGTGHTVTLPTNFTRPCAVDTTASLATWEAGYYDGTNFIVTSCGTSQTPTILSGPTRTAPGTPSTGVVWWFDSTANLPQSKDTSGNLNSMVRTASSGTGALVDYIAATGIPHTRQVVIGDVASGSLQGNGAKIQAAGTISGAGAALCTDANGNTTTVGCPTATVDNNTIKNAEYCPDTSVSANTITCTTTTTFPGAYAAGQSVRVLLANAVTGATTININSLGAKAVTKNGSTALASGDLSAGTVYTLTYDGTRFVVSVPAGGGGGTVSSVNGATGAVVVTITAGTGINVSGGAGTAPTVSVSSPIDTYTRCVVFGADNGPLLLDADLGPQTRMLMVPVAITVTEFTVTADAGTPSIQVRKNHAGTTTNLLSGALATAASGGIACTKTSTSTACLDGATTSSGTITVSTTAIAAGDWIEFPSGTAGGAAHKMTACITGTIN